MATTGKGTDAPKGSDDVADRLKSAEFVHLVAHRNGDALAGTCLIGQALDERKIPYQISFAEIPRNGQERKTTDATVLGVGLENVGRTLQSTGALSERAFQIADTLGTDPDPILAIAGVRAAGEIPSDILLEHAREAGAEQDPGIGIPTTDLVTGLAYSGVIHADFSGDETATESFLADIIRPEEMDEDARRTIASAVAMHVSTTPCPDRSVAAVSTGLGSLRGGPFETTTGYGDVLAALARETPGLACQFVLGRADPEAVLETWKRFNTSVHQTLEELDLSAENSLAVTTVTGADPWSVSRLANAYCNPGSAVLVRGVKSDGGQTVALATAEGNAIEELGGVISTNQVAGRTDLAIGITSDADAVVDQLRERR